MWPTSLEPKFTDHLNLPDLCSSEEFSTWLDKQLELLEREFTDFTTPASVKNSLLNGRGQ